MELRILPFALTVCKLPDAGSVDPRRGFCFFANTGEEISLVCRTEDAPPVTLAREDGWRAFRVAGTLDFSLTGILAGLSGILAEQGVGIFAVSTYDTDYILVKEEKLARAAEALAGAGHTVV